MPHPLVLAVFQDRPTAAEAARRLRELGVDRDDLSVVARTHAAEGALAAEMGATPGSELEDSRPIARLGELGGHLAAAFASILPGVGHIVSAGPLAAEFGEAAGHLAGGMAGVLTDAGLSEARAASWQLKVSNGALLLGVHVRQGDPGRVGTVLEESGADEVVQAAWE